MIAKLLIANRGEIAVRIARTARAMGIPTVAVFSEADADALHTRIADEAVAIGPSPAAESYLVADRLIAAARQSGATAIHPGYGFLSENAAFAEAVVAAGVTWVGPPAAAIRAMGLKDAAKRRMEAAGVPITPGYHGEDQAPELLAERAGEIGYPVLIKAVAGGGGKGMRRVDRAADFADAFERAQSEARSAFGNPRVLIEKFIDRPRHIEVQVFADAHGNTVHLYERDCSLQRRHQKVLEEAPAPGMTPELRAAMTAAAVRAAEAVGYVGAGTVEFIVDGGRMTPDAFFFMEMNTRLQVEHPVTEAVTGIDLVAWQLSVAAGAPLPLAQDEIALEGHAVEARLYAEDPAAEFMPEAGRITALQWPEAAPGLRIDAGVAEGDRITPHYDPMIAKIIAHGPDREAAFGRLGEALAGTQLAGLGGNLDFLDRLAGDPAVRRGEVDTGLIGRALAGLTAPPEPEAADLALGAAALAGLLAPDPRAGWRAWGPGRTHLTLSTQTAEYAVALIPHAVGREGVMTAETPLGPVNLALRAAGGSAWHVAEVADPLAAAAAPSDGHRRRIHIHRAGSAVVLATPGRRIRLMAADALASDDAEAGGTDEITAPLPGRVIRVAVAPGEAVVMGAALAVVEAMKMEHTLRAHRDGRVAEVLAAADDQVGEGTVLITLEPEA